MRPTNINIVAHNWIKEIITSTSIAIDATIGNGNDTLFLASHCYFVYGFDIQTVALSNTKNMLTHLTNFELICDSHTNMSHYVKQQVDLVVFNLGYLPKGDPTITTTAPLTMQAIKEAAKLLKSNGYLFITFYIGHLNGKTEHDCFIEQLELMTAFKLLKSYTYQDRKDAPILYLLQRT
ncbi:MAG: class I SAM-dependent methyltransferase [Erysipelotrichaceae bacterium]|nr:class I SAM-dependent methyltransferase [Erysipelotrichaceae bacterium]